MKAIKFASEKHVHQRRKGSDQTPYINHPLAVAELLASLADVGDVEVLTAAVLHDTIEDTATLADEIEQLFGARVLGLVLECTDDKTLPSPMRKELQVRNAPHKSRDAKLIKIADKANNVGDMAICPPANWTLQRRREYIDWTERVVQGLRGVNPKLEDNYDQALKAARARLAADETRG